MGVPFTGKKRSKGLEYYRTGKEGAKVWDYHRNGKDGEYRRTGREGARNAEYYRRLQRQFELLLQIFSFAANRKFAVANTSLQL